MVFVKLSPNAVDFLRISKSNDKKYLGIKITQEACLFGAEVYFEFTDEVDESLCSKVETEGMEFFVSNEFSRFFDPLSSIVLDIKGHLRKKVAVIEPQPFIKNICKS